MDTNERDDTFLGWLQKFTYQWACHLTFPPSFSQREADASMRQWLDDLRKELGTAEFGYFLLPGVEQAIFEVDVLTELEKTGGYQCYMLVIGLRKWDTEERIEWTRRWQRIAGDARITGLAPGFDSGAYIEKHSRPHDVVEFEIPQAHQGPIRMRREF